MVVLARKVHLSLERLSGTRCELASSVTRLMRHLMRNTAVTLLLRAEVIADRVMALPVVILLLETDEALSHSLLIARCRLEVLRLLKANVRPILRHATIHRLQIGQALR